MVGLIYYSALVKAEILGPSSSSHVLHVGAIEANDINLFMPIYVIYDGSRGVIQLSVG
jgi:hypothetical protein